MKPIYKNFNLHSIMELICEFIRLILQSIKLIYQSTPSSGQEKSQPIPSGIALAGHGLGPTWPEARLLFLCGLCFSVLWPGRHNGVELRVLGETVNKGNRHVPEEQQALPGIAVRHIGKLVGAYP